jgi:hypothetical protein
LPLTDNLVMTLVPRVGLSEVIVATGDMISPSTFGARKELSVGVRALSPKPANEVEIDAGQGSADLVHRTACGERPEIYRD